MQFDVVKDGRTSDICSPLDKLIFEVDSPVLAYYFPPNHFNCRTRVRKLRNGVSSKNYTLPDIPTEFKNNAGMCPPAYKKLLSNDKDKKPIRKECGEIFTEENRYIKNTPKEVLDEAEKIYKIRRIIEILEKPRIKQFTTIYEYENGGKVLLHDLVDTQATDYNSILLAAKEFAKKGDVSEILPIINNKEIKQYRSIVFPNYNLNKNPDLRINEVYHDIKEVKSIKASQGNANNAAKQNAIAIIQYDGKDLTNKLMEQQAERIFNKNNINNEGKHNYLFKIVYFLHNGKLYKYNRD